MSARRSHPRVLLYLWVVVGAVTACAPDSDLIAVAAGDYDPNHPPKQLALSGDLEIHNPFLLKEGEGYAVYGSNGGIVQMTSPTLETFTNAPRLFEENPAWIADVLPAEAALWSPSVAVFGGQQHLYYAVSVFGQTTSCLGHATRSLSSTGAWHDAGRILCSNVDGVTADYNAIDPSPYVSETGSAFLVFGSYETGIKLLTLDESGKKSDSPLVSLASRPAETPAIQAPSLMKRGDSYYLFASFDRCCAGVDSTYDLRVGRSRNLEGPYVDRGGVPLLEGGGTLLLEGDERFKGPGSSEVFVDGSNRYLVYHAYDVERSGQAVLRISELRFDNEGWPVVSGP